MPTSFWVTCPSLVAAISRVESTGGVREAQRGGRARRRSRRSTTSTAPATAPASPASARARGSVKCLHAFTALHLSGAIPNPVAEWTLGRLGNPYPEDALLHRGGRKR